MVKGMNAYLETLTGRKREIEKEVSGLQKREKDLSSMVRIEEKSIRMAERFHKFMESSGTEAGKIDSLISKPRSLDFDARIVLALRDSMNMPFLMT